MINIDKKLFLQHPTNIIAITSGVGSMGKTWLATTLAHALNILHQSVLLFDADSGLLNADFQLATGAGRYLDDVINGNITMNQAIVAVNKKKFDVIAAAAGSEVLKSVPDGRLQILSEELSILARCYKYTIMDLSSSEKIIRNLLPMQVNLILVCTQEPSNLVSTYQFLQNMGELAQYGNLQIVVNYANSQEDGMRTYNTLRQACEQYIKKTPQLLGVIRRDTRVRDAIRNHSLFLSRYQHSEAAEDVMAIAHKLVEKGEQNATEL